jgi:cell cycle related kinase
VIKLLEVLPQGICFVLVFEYMPTGLGEMIKDAEIPLTEAQIKRYLEMLLQGVEYLHSNYIMHRVYTHTNYTSIHLLLFLAGRSFLVKK